MRIVKPSAKILPPVGSDSYARFERRNGIDILRRIEWCARISHASEDSQTGDSWERFIKSVVIDHGDFSVIEHGSVSVDFLVDRGVTHELVRHRLFSFTQNSTRFINYSKKCPAEFIYPDPENWEGWIDDPGWCNSIAYSENMYKEKIAEGWPPPEG